MSQTTCFRDIEGVTYTCHTSRMQFLFGKRAEDSIAKVVQKLQKYILEKSTHETCNINLSGATQIRKILWEIRVLDTPFDL
jgi:hypothetical protein